MDFQQTLATLPTADHLRGLDVVDGAGAVVRHIPAAPGKMGSLRVYHALADRFGGRLDAEAVAQGLAWFAEQPPESLFVSAVTVLEREKNMGVRGLPTYEVKLDDVRVTRDARLGGDAGGNIDLLLNPATPARGWRLVPLAV